MDTTDHALNAAGAGLGTDSGKRPASQPTVIAIMHPGVAVVAIIAVVAVIAVTAYTAIEWRMLSMTDRALFVVITVVALVVALVATLMAVGALPGPDRGSARERDERTRLDAQLRLLLHGNQLAIEMHDTLSNDLTLISTIARQHAGDSDDPDDPHRDDWALVLERSQKAFAEVHGIIRFLSDTTTATVAGIRNDDGGRGGDAIDTADSAFVRITDQVSATRRFLERLGYRGQAAVSGIVMTPSPQAEREALSLITEIGTNVSRHVAPGEDAYLLYVSLSADAIEIRETNDIPGADAAPKLGETERSGRGLAMHRRRIAELGGVLRTRAEEGVWMVYARIPCRGA